MLQKAIQTRGYSKRILAPVWEQNTCDSWGYVNIKNISFFNPGYKHVDLKRHQVIP